MVNPICGWGHLTRRFFIFTKTFKLMMNKRNYESQLNLRRVMWKKT